jgi:hypothetical protein
MTSRKGITGEIKFIVLLNYMIMDTLMKCQVNEVDLGRVLGGTQDTMYVF